MNKVPVQVSESKSMQSLLRKDPAQESITVGSPFPLGSTVTPMGINFCVFSSHATHMCLLLFNSCDAPRASRIIHLDPSVHRTSHYWHIHVGGIGAGQIYGYRMSGPNDPKGGHRFAPEKLLLDPYCKSVSSSLYQRKTAIQPGDNEESSLRSVVVDLGVYDWEADAPLHTPYTKTVIYEVHVGGFTRNPNSGISEAKRGTYAGLVDKIPYLKTLGITAVELLPVFQFDWQDAPEGLENYWGYSPVSFFSPHQGYSSNPTPMGCLDEFRDMVKALHRAGIELILDVVYNHTAEGGVDGPTISFKGIDNKFYYMLSPDFSAYADYTGTGNTLNTNQSVLRRLVLDSLRFWVSEMHVDGFRFDLASILSRDEHGNPIANSPILWDIDADPILSGTKLMAEAWDAGGLYQVGSFGGDRWKEWNGRFRDDIRSVVKGDHSTVQSLRMRLLGSPDLYFHRYHLPEQSINFVTCHDGFTLNDLVSFDHKHNELNKQDNRDGSDDNRSWNCGQEGNTSSLEIETIRSRQVRNFLTLTLLSMGTPFLLMGDEVRRTQKGNNNAYCQNNEISWFDWSLVDRHRDLSQFVQHLIRLRKYFSLGLNGNRLSLIECIERARIRWSGVQLSGPDLSEDSHSLAVTAYLESGSAVHIMLNFYWEPLEFTLPPITDPTYPWQRIIDTYDPVPDGRLSNSKRTITGPTYKVESRSITLLGSGTFEYL
ncbi:glycogen debranching protein GlgX [Granulicella sp. dw_53]|uniref:glycogen debranching protein GlgX n=1 Tax=Granulicella sp. dw_53 TaxID=2719792 RepID=UPI002104063B|nr:glycogen debranching protein GlgX [Granulicella sp. dw_53]